MTERPLVSVCVPSYNHALYLPACIESVLAQSHRPIELIIADDGSTDGSFEIALRYAAANPAVIRVLTHPGRANRGISATENLCFKNCEGEFWCELGSDDQLLPNMISNHLAYLQQHSAVGLVYGVAEIVDSSGDRQGQLFGADIGTGEPALRRLIHGNAVPALTVLARRAAMNVVGLHTEGIVYGDWEYLVRFANRFPIAFVPEVVALYRVHGNNISVISDLDKQAVRAEQVLSSLAGLASSAGGLLQEPRTQRYIASRRLLYAAAIGNTTLCSQQLDFLMAAPHIFESVSNQQFWNQFFADLARASRDRVSAARQLLRLCQQKLPHEYVQLATRGSSWAMGAHVLNSFATKNWSEVFRGLRDCAELGPISAVGEVASWVGRRVFGTTR